MRTEFAGRSITESPVVIPDYAATAGKRRRDRETVHGRQPGDPVKAAHAIIEAVASAAPPELLLLGRDALSTVSGILATPQAGIQAWADVSSGIDLDAP